MDLKEYAVAKAKLVSEIKWLEAHPHFPYCLRYRRNKLAEMEEQWQRENK